MSRGCFSGKFVRGFINSRIPKGDTSSSPLRLMASRAAVRLEKECRQLLATNVIYEASRMLRGPCTSAQELADASKCSLGISWTKDIARQASARKMSAMIRRGFSNPVASEFTKQLRLHLRDVWRSFAGETAHQSTAWQASIDANGLAQEATTQGREDSLTQTQGRNWEVPRDGLKDARQRQLLLRLRFSVTAKNVRHLDSRRGETSLAESNTQNASQLVDMLARGSTEGSSIWRASVLPQHPGEPIGGGPRTKVANIAATADTVEQIRRYETIAGKVNILEWCNLGLKCVAPGIRCREYLTICTGDRISHLWRGRRIFRPVERRSSTSRIQEKPASFRVTI